MALNLQESVNDLLIRGLDDDIQAAEVAGVAQRHGAITESEIRDASLKMIQEVIQRGLMKVGDVIGSGTSPTYRFASVQFRPWNLSTNEALQRIAREWIGLGRNPSLGEICWLNNTDKGDAIANQIVQLRKNPR